jgi:UDP-glucose 4-epimerase
MKRALITGGAGFIGSHLVDRCVKEGYQVAILDDFSTGQRENIAHHPPSVVEVWQADLASSAWLKWYQAFEPDLVFHYAAQIDVRKSVADPAADANVNVLGSLRLLEAIRHSKKKPHIVFASTGGAIYGEDAPLPTPETHPCAPISPYGIAKRAFELYLGYYRHQYGMTGSCMRFANVYGPRQNPHGEAGVCAIFISKMDSAATDPATQGPVINGDGLQTRDFTYVGDIAEACWIASQKRLNDHFNVGTGVMTTVVQVFDAIAKATGFKGERVHREAAPGEQRESQLDASKLAKATGFKPSTPFQQGIDETVAWYRLTQAARA